MAPEDFDAQTLIDVANAKAMMAVNWDPASTTAIARLDDAGMQLDLTGNGRFHHVIRAGVLTDLVTLPTSPVIVPANTDGRGIYAISQGGTTRLFLGFAAFADSLQRSLDAGAAVQRLNATGRFDDDDVTLKSRRLRIVLR